MQELNLQEINEVSGGLTGTQAVVAAGTGAGMAATGAYVGASYGAFGGPIGAVVGAMAGAAISYGWFSLMERSDTTNRAQ